MSYDSVYAYPFHFDPPSNVSSSALVVFIHAWLLCCCFIELIENQLSQKCWINMQIFLLYWYPLLNNGLESLVVILDLRY